MRDGGGAKAGRRGVAVAAGGGPKESEASGWPWWVAIERIVWPLLLCAGGGGEHIIIGRSDSE